MALLASHRLSHRLHGTPLASRSLDQGLIPSATQGELAALRPQGNPKAGDAKNIVLVQSAAPRPSQTVVLGRGLKRKLQREKLATERSHRRRREAKLGLEGRPLLALAGEQTVLEQKHPSRPVVRDYSNRLAKFSAFVSEVGHSEETPEELDDALADYADYLFLAGRQSDWGYKLKAALEHRKPEFGKFGTKRLPRFQKILKSWQRFAPQECGTQLRKFCRRGSVRPWC